MAAGPMVARISGSWSRCSRVRAAADRSDTSSGPTARRPVLGQGVPRPLVDRLVRAPEVGDRLGQQPPLADGGEDLLEQDQGEERLEHGQQGGRRPGGRAGDRDLEQVVGVGQVQHVHDAQEVDQGVGQEVGVGRRRPPHGVPVRPTAVEPLVEQGEPADRPDGGGGEQGDADLVAVPDQVDGQPLPLQRVVDGLVPALDLVPLQVDEHVRQAGGHAHREGRGRRRR